MVAAVLDIHRRETEAGVWENIPALPAAALRTHIRSYEGWTERNAAPSTQRHVPSGMAVIIINLGPPLRVHYPTSTGDQGLLQTFVAGTNDAYAETDSNGHAEGLQINLTAIGARLLVDAPMSGLTNRAVELEDLLGPVARRTLERLHDAPAWDRRFAILDEVIGARLAAASGVPDGAMHAWRQLVQSRGRVSIGPLATEVGWSRKHLVTQFREHIGLPPKTFARVLRFDRARGLLEQGSRWMEIAYECGYYDQAHMIRDFSEFSGEPPRQFLVRALSDRARTARR
jgi:AraC-like DNA-binding protein